MGRRGQNPRGKPLKKEPFEGTSPVQGVLHFLFRFTDSNIYYQRYTDFEQVNFYR